MGAVRQGANGHPGGQAPLPAELVLGDTPVFKEPRLLGGRLLWLEQRPAERGRTTLRMRTAPGQELELTPGLDLRSRIHGYGGGVYSVAGDMAVVVAEGGGSLWRLDLPGELGAEACTGPGPDPTAPDSSASAARPEADDRAAAVPEPVRLTPAMASSRVTASGEPAALYGDGVIDLARRRWIGVCEQQERDRLVVVSLAGAAPRWLWESPDFCGYAALSPTGSHLAWVSWRQPCLPWERSQLWLGRFDARGDLVDVRAIAGSVPGEGQAVSVFQPLWAGPDLVVANDRSGWWNLEVLKDAEALSAAAVPDWRPLLPLQAEFAMPQWVYGMRTTAWDGRQLLAAACRDGRWQLGALVPNSRAKGCSEASEPAGSAAADLHGTAAAGSIAPAPQPVPPGRQPSEAGSDTAEASPGEASRVSLQPQDPGLEPAIGGRHAPERAGEPAPQPCSTGMEPPPTEAAPGLRAPLHWQPIPLPFDDLAGLDAENGTLVAIASGPVDGPGLLELTLRAPADPNSLAPSQPDGGGRRWRHLPATPPVLAPERISIPEPLWFAGHGGHRTHAWYYPPPGGAGRDSPLLVRGHSGPTAMARTGLNLTIQFWSSRGWGVVDVNYGGSTGFGRAYRERLDGGWGVVDVDDCLAAARAVVDSGRADPARIAMEGSSASGFTVLAAMARGDTIRAGAIRYPVTDLTALAEGDHRFEARYFDALVGPWPEARTLYEQRSPLHQVKRIHAPLLFFHGLDDTVVPAQQSITMVERLRQRGVPVELQLFEAEGHGFRDGRVQRQVLERSEAFFRERFALPEPG